MKLNKFDKAVLKAFLFWLGVIALFWFLSVTSGCSTTYPTLSRPFPTLTVQKDNFVHYASYRVYKDSVWVATMDYYGALEVSEDKVINDYKTK